MQGKGGSHIVRRRPLLPFLHLWMYFITLGCSCIFRCYLLLFLIYPLYRFYSGFVVLYIRHGQQCCALCVLCVLCVWPCCSSLSFAVSCFQMYGSCCNNICPFQNNKEIYFTYLFISLESVFRWSENTFFTLISVSLQDSDLESGTPSISRLFLLDWLSK